MANEEWWSMTGKEYPDLPKLRTDVPHSARIYNWLIGGKDHFPADRAAGEAALAANPALRAGPVEGRRFLARAVHYLAREAGIRQYLDIGTGIPTAGNTHEVAQEVDPSARVVYVDNDPMVLVHARALLGGDPAGRTAYIDADLRDPDSILCSQEVAATLDLGQPVGLLLLGILHFIRDSEDPYGIVQKLLGALPAGSHLVVGHVTADLDPVGIGAAREAYHQRGLPFEPRSREEVARFFDGLELVEPGIVMPSDWRSDLPEAERPSAVHVSGYAAVGRKAG
jgi:S-adenosyl methyltransferase